jgi:hypothetical protein
MAHIFISYSRKDIEPVDRLVNVLEANGYHIWIDRHADAIRGGDLWKRRVVDAIKRANAFVLALSPESVKSDQVRRELDIADETGILILPIWIKRAALPADIDFTLKQKQTISLDANWNDGIARILNALREARKITQPKGISPEGRKELDDILASPNLSIQEKVKFFSAKYGWEADKARKPILDRIDQLGERDAKLSSEYLQAIQRESELRSEREQLSQGGHKFKHLVQLYDTEISQLREKAECVREEQRKTFQELIKTMENMSDVRKEELDKLSNSIQEANHLIRNMFK